MANDNFTLFKSQEDGTPQKADTQKRYKKVSKKPLEIESEKESTLSKKKQLDEEEIYTVSLLTKAIEKAVATYLPSAIKLQGETSNLKYHSSGHIYFTLKDNDAQINAIIWKSTVENLNLSIQDGDELLVEGYISFYASSGRYQIICHRVRKVGLGELQAEFERLFKKLEKEGLFSEEYKKRLPRYPERIGVVTSETGAVIQDIRSVFHRRYPSGELVLYPSQVQGESAAKDISNGIAYFNSLVGTKNEVDVIIIARGGGSLEDLWAFNTETVAYAVFRSTVPIISAVGHEVDYSISDYVADVRAGTPSIAAELVAPDASGLLQAVLSSVQVCQSQLYHTISEKRAYIKSIIESRALASVNRKIDFFYQKEAFLMDKLHGKVVSLLQEKKLKLSFLIKTVSVLSIDAIQKKGFAVIFHKGKVIASGKDLKNGDNISIKFYDGTQNATIT